MQTAHAAARGGGSTQTIYGRGILHTGFVAVSIVQYPWNRGSVQLSGRAGGITSRRWALAGRDERDSAPDGWGRRCDSRSQGSVAEVSDVGD